MQCVPGSSAQGVPGYEARYTASKFQNSEQFPISFGQSPVQNKIHINTKDITVCAYSRKKSVAINKTNNLKRVIFYTYACVAIYLLLHNSLVLKVVTIYNGYGCAAILSLPLST